MSALKNFRGHSPVLQRLCYSDWGLDPAHDIWPLRAVSARLARAISARQYWPSIMPQLHFIAGHQVSQAQEASWLQIRLEAAAGEGEIIAEALAHAGALSVTLEDAADNPVLEPLPGEAPLWPHTAVIGLFEADTDMQPVLASVGKALARATPPRAHITTLRSEDWESVWKNDFGARRFGNRLWVCPHGENAPVPDAVIVHLDPGLAFGTGNHPSTALCLEWLDGHCQHGDRIIDYGCGSGILAIAALRLGAARAWAVDIDAQAVLATMNNARDNDVAGCTWAGTPQHLTTALAGENATCLLANILARPLIDLAPRFAELLPTGARIAVAGILQEQIDEVSAALAPWFELTEPRIQENWALLHGQRR
jgi:ribosomal protein L11 methyltransferase